MSIPWWQCIAITWNRTAQRASRNEPLKTRKIHSALDRVRYIDSYTDVYEIIAYIHIIHTHTHAKRWIILDIWSVLVLAKLIWQTRDSVGSLLWYLPTWGSSAMVLFWVLQICPEFKDALSHTQLKTQSSLCRVSGHLWSCSWYQREAQFFLYSMVLKIEQLLTHSRSYIHT